MVTFDEERELAAGFDLINWVTFPNESILRVKVGMIDPKAHWDKDLNVNEETITWPSTFKQVVSDKRFRF